MAVINYCYKALSMPILRKKLRIFIKGFLSKCDQETADLVAFTE